MTMSLWDELLSKVENISCHLAKNIQEGLDLGIAALDEFERDTLSARLKVSKTKPKQLQAIDENKNEDGTPPTKPGDHGSGDASEPASDKALKQDPVSSDERNDAQETDRCGSKKRGKDELQNGTPEQDKRHKRTASVRAQNIITKQINVNLSQKLRRPHDDEDKENAAGNAPALVQVKQEKISVAPEPAAAEWEPSAAGVAGEKDADACRMPPPPAAKTRGTRRKPPPDAVKTEPATEEAPSRRSTRARKQTDAAPPAVDVSSRASTRPSTRASARLASSAQEDMPPPPALGGTRTRKQQQAELATSESEHSGSEKPHDEAVDVNEKPRPKRTRRARKGEKSESEAETKTEERPMSPPLDKMRAEKNLLSSPVISAPAKKMKKSTEKVITTEKIIIEKIMTDKLTIETAAVERNVIEKIVNNEKHVENEVAKDVIENSRDVSVINDSVEIFEDERKTIELLSCASIDKVDEDVDNAEKKDERQQTTAVMNETIVLSKAPTLMNETVTLNTIGSGQMTNDSSLLTSDGDTPPRSAIPVKLPTSAVKERVQLFEELASGSGSGGARLTRTKTRALSKQDAEKEKISPRDEADRCKFGMLSATIEKLKNLPQKYNQLSLSASKPPNNIVTSVKSFLPTPTVKPPLPAKPEERRLEERERERDKEDARRKKEALLEAKREEQRRRRENKMAAAAAARDAQVRERAAQMQARERAWQDKQTHVDLGKAEKLKLAEKKRLLLEKKAAETEERRRVEETARLARLEEERRKADAVRQRQQEEAERIRREEQRNEREMQLARQQYMERLQQKKLENLHTPMSRGGTPCKMAPVHMADGFQYLNSDSEDESKHMPTPDWSRTKARSLQLRVQDLIATGHIDKLFSVRRHTPDLSELFPSIDRKLYKRTSSAVWRTPPPLPPPAADH